MPLTNILKKSLAKGKSTQSGSSRWAALGLILSMTACTSLAAADMPSLGTPPQDPTLSLTANPVQEGKGGEAMLSWASQHTTSCTASAGWSGIKGTSGMQTVKNITSSQTYNLTCAGTAKTVSATVKAAVVSAPPPPSAVRVRPLVVGLNVNQFMGGSFDAAGQAFTTELGPHSIRVGYKHGDHNFGVNWAAQRGIGVLFFLGYGSGCSPTTASGRQCYADRSAALAQKYGAKVQYYEVWNEWNGGLGLGKYPGCKPTCTDGFTYADLLRRTYIAIKAVRPQAIVVAGATAGAHTNFLTGILKAGAGSYMDAYSIHPYPFSVHSGFGAPGSPAPVLADKFIEAITVNENILRQNTGRTIPILVTEEGILDNPSSEQRTAEFLTAIYNRAPSVPFLEGIWWFGLEDVPSGAYGLLRSNNTKKPSFVEYQAAANK